MGTTLARRLQIKTAAGCVQEKGSSHHAARLEVRYAQLPTAY
jgi:hypothetical protein